MDLKDHLIPTPPYMRGFLPNTWPKPPLFQSLPITPCLPLQFLVQDPSLVSQQAPLGAGALL